MDILTLSLLLAAIAIYEEVLNGKYQLTRKILDRIEKKEKRMTKKIK